jgi:tRNA pseudouridine65 synthase
MHQIRRHFAHLRHYIIGDTTHGDNRQNHFFVSQFKLRNMLLHAWQLNFKHPYSGNAITISAPLPTYFENTMKQLGWKIEELTKLEL